MQTLFDQIKPTRSRCGLLLACCALFLNACADGTDSASGGTALSSPQISAQLASATTTLELDVATLPDEAASQTVLPAFHVAPVFLNPPDDADNDDNAASARRAPRRQSVPAEFARLSSRHLTLQTLESAHRQHLQNINAQGLVADGSLAPMASGSVVATYSPAQIRAAYGLPALPATGTTPSAAQAAQMGAGQTIYIIDAMHDPNAAAELAAFNQKFGLPGCTTKAIAANTSLPLATASASGCEFSVVFSTASSTMSSTAPPYDSGWATEIALDVQWAHATAPLARIILIEAGDSSLNGLLGAIKLANAMGPGIVSMSLGGPEGNWTSSVDAAFTGKGVSYLAATGDSGASVQWPAVSPNVVAVGGTTLSYSGSGSRSEVTWSGTGGGTSMYTPTPAYQNNAVPGMGYMAHRAVADVAFNADPNTGQYVAILKPGASAVSWISVGGTSLSTPQWAGIIAIANASRVLVNNPVLGAPHAALYGQIATVPGTYASAFADITKGADGSCSTCSARVGYDQVTGLGTPNVGSLISSLSGATATVPSTASPVVTPASISGTVGTALSFTVSVTAPNPVSYALSGAPSGMSISSAGAVTWPIPLAGTYPVTVTAKDSKTGLSGQGLYTVNIAAASAPVVTSASISGTVGTALSFSVTVKAANPVSYTLSGAPTGMAISSSGLLTWTAPVAGSYSVTVTAKDSKTGLSGQAVVSIKINPVTVATSRLLITAPAMTGVVGKALSGTISIADPGATSLSVSISGAPMGMSFSVSGLNITAYWPSPVLGSYSLKVSAADSSGQSASTNVSVTILAK